MIVNDKAVEAGTAVLLGRVNAPEQEIYRAFRDALTAALPHLVPEWMPIESMPTETGTRIRALVETELVMEEYIPSVLMGGWQRTSYREKIVGWLPAAPSIEEGKPDA